MPRGKRKPHHHSVDDDLAIPLETESHAPERDFEAGVNSSRRGPENPVPHGRCRADLLSEACTPSEGRLLTLQDPDPSTVPTRTRPVDITWRNNATSTLEQLTPPSEYGNTPDVDNVSPPAHSTTISSARSTPSHITSTITQSPPPNKSSLTQHQSAFSTPSQHGRPSSLTNSRPALLVDPRTESAYGSPSPTRHPPTYFPGAHNINSAANTKKNLGSSPKSTFRKFVRLPRSASFKYGIVTGHDHTLQVSSYDGNEVRFLGTLYDLPGVVTDAEILFWRDSGGVLPLAQLHIALTLYHTENSSTGTIYRSSSVQVYSLSKQEHSCELLKTPVRSTPAWASPLLQSQPEAADLLRLRASGRFLIVSSGISGEIFAFAASRVDELVAFECIGKFWTTIQPRPKAKSMSQTQAHASKQDQATALDEESVPILALSGRWLAVCAPSSTSSQSVSVVLGTSVRINKQADLDLVTPGTSPTPTCHVESPDVETVVSKIARTAAQGFMKSGQWIANTGAHAWNSYWKRDEDFAEAVSTTQYDSQPTTDRRGLFPPTHTCDSAPSKNPVVIAIYDLEMLLSTRKHVRTPMVVFEPPKGCSFLSFAPHGLQLLSASRKGDYHYVWDLFESKHVRQALSHLEDGSRAKLNVRQVARYERLSGSIIVDVVWDIASPVRFALLTRNKTIHLYDLPGSAVRWPPARPSSVQRMSWPSVADSSLHHNLPRPSGFLASVSTLASTTQTSLASLKTRAPSMSGGLSGIGAAGLGLAAATGTRGARAVGTGISKSFSAATDAVVTARHVGGTRMSVKNVKSVAAGRLAWMIHNGGSSIGLLGDDSIRLYSVRTGNDNTSQRTNMTVFGTKNAGTIRLMPIVSVTPQTYHTADAYGDWYEVKTQRRAADLSHPLSHAEIETTSPYTPFYSDHRVTLSVFTSPVSEPDVAAQESKKKIAMSASETWIFGDPIMTTKLDLGRHAQIDDNDDDGSVIIREITTSATITGDEEHIVSTARRKRVKRRTGEEEGEGGEGFFEDGCDVLDFATDRV